MVLARCARIYPGLRISWYILYKAFKKNRYPILNGSTSIKIEQSVFLTIFSIVPSSSKTRIDHLGPFTKDWHNLKKCSTFFRWQKLPFSGNSVKKRFYFQRLCWSKEACKEEFQAVFICRCPEWSYCRSPGRYYNAYCSFVEAGYIWMQSSKNNST